MVSLSESEREDFQRYIAEQLSLVPGFDEDIKEIAEYIALLVNNGRPLEETLSQLNDLFGNHDLRQTLENVYKALETFNQQKLAASTQQPVQGAQDVVLDVPVGQDRLQQQQQQQQQQQVSNTQDEEPDLILGNRPTRSLPTKPASYSRGGYGVSKNGRGGFRNNNNSNTRNFAFKNQEAIAKALNLSALAGSDAYINAKGQIKKKGRCDKFPHCPLGKNCMYAHPSTVCFRFQEGKCENAPGTCNYLHPGEDDALIEEWNKVKEFYQEKRSKAIQNQVGLTLCKFGVTCSNQQCPFGHPTPANEDAKVITLEWCPENLNCSNPSCTKAHSSLSKIREVKPFKQQVPQQQAPQERSLAACKFGMNCTNRHCKFRHATSPVLCRDGANCTRIDCYFSHPIDEECRFGEQCKNPKCLFQHPNGKAQTAVPAKNLTWTKTNERQFAVPDDQVLETAPAQEG